MLGLCVQLSWFTSLCVFLTDPEELCGDEGSSSLTWQSSGAGSHDALLHRAQAAEERARRSEEALARAMDDLHKLKSGSFSHDSLL